MVCYRSSPYLVASKPGPPTAKRTLRSALLCEKVMTNIIIIVVLFELFLLLLFQKVSNYSPVLEVSYTAVESSVTC